MMSALALVREIAHVHVHHAREHFVAHALQGPRAHVLHGPCAEVAEQVAHQADADGYNGQQHQYVLAVVLFEDVRIGEVEKCCEVVLIEFQGRQLFDAFEGVVRVEHGVQDRDDQHERQRVEQRVEKRVEEVGDRVFLDRPGKTQQPHVCFEHSERMFVGLRNSRRKDRNNDPKSEKCTIIRWIMVDFVPKKRCGGLPFYRSAGS